MGRIQIWPGERIVGAVQQLGGSRKAGDDFQILLNALDECNHRMAAVAIRRNEELRRSGDVNDRGRWQKRRYEFCKQVWGWVRNPMAERIQVIWPLVHQDVLAILNNGCESSRGGL